MPNDEKQNKAADIDIEELNYAKEVVAQRVKHFSICISYRVKLHFFPNITLIRS
jgi:hypothetical protein